MVVLIFPVFVRFFGVFGSWFRGDGYKWVICFLQFMEKQVIFNHRQIGLNLLYVTPPHSDYLALCVDQDSSPGPPCWVCTWEGCVKEVAREIRSLLPELRFGLESLFGFGPC